MPAINPRRELLIAGLSLICGVTALGAELRIGIIGCDTSHATEFAKIINNPANASHVPGGKVVAAFKGGSPDVQYSTARIEEFSQQLREKQGVVFYETIEQMCANVDAVLLESVDGRVHLEQVKPVLRARKPVFIDKPMAASLKDVVEIFRLARESNVPVWSSSSLRFGKATKAVRDGSIGRVSVAEVSGPCEQEPHHPELYWYGVHGVESLFTVLGRGCEMVKRTTGTNGQLEVIGTWSGGRQGVLRAADGFSGVARGDRGVADIGQFDGYAPLVAEVIRFFQTGIAPIQEEETIEIFAFLEASAESKRLGGKPVSLSDVLARAVTLNTLTEAERLVGWQLLWDGQTTTGWRGVSSEFFPTNNWKIADGNLTVRVAGGEAARKPGDIMTTQRFANFELAVDFRNSTGGNSGIYYLVQSDPGKGGFEFQVIDDDNPPEGLPIRYSPYGLGALYDLYPTATAKHVNPVGQWNTVRIVCHGQSIEHWLNGKRILQCKRGTEDFQVRVGHSKFKDISGFGTWRDGHILLQDHGSTVSFRNFKIRELPAPEPQ